MKFIQLTVLVVLGLFLLSTGCQEQKTDGAPPNQAAFTLVYYAIPNCSNCARVKNTLTAIQEQYPAIYHLVVLPTTSDEGKADLQMYQLGSHGLLIFAGDQMIKSVPGRLLDDATIHHLLDSLRQTLPKTSK